ncbi:hypothetical protein ECSTECC16502_4916 [Escherichia coli STEC_C165-02]|nr:hypothetical protein ECSTECC16502_1327 [Escherichia coli STEC_C165-02]EGW76088.1 hypothetical protein ECSTECC16502_4916 [Escherichia coli STEC_C165-02]
MFPGHLFRYDWYVQSLFVRHTAGSQIYVNLIPFFLTFGCNIPVAHV